MGEYIKNDNIMLLKLTSAGLLMAAAQEKVNNYVKKNYDVYQEMMEDEEALEYFNLYYEDNEMELKKAAHESLFTTKEVEDILDNWSSTNEFEG